MIFNNPLFLWAFAALAIPVAIHLFNFRRTKRVFFSNVNLLKKIEQETTSMRSLKNRVILLARLLMLSMLILAFAQPSWVSNSAKTAQGKLKAIFIDNSVSMMQTSADGKSSNLDLAVATAENLTKTFDGNTKIQVSTSAGSLNSGIFRNKGAATDLLRSIKPGESSTNLPSTLSKINLGISREALSDRKSEVYIFSDFQKAEFAGLKTQLKDTNIIYKLVKLEPDKAGNASVDSVWLAEPVVKQNGTNRMMAKISNSGKEKAEKLNVKLVLNNTIAGTSTIDLEPESKGILNFDFKLGAQNINTGKIVIESNDADFDNERLFTLNTGEKINVTVLCESDGEVWDAAFGNNELFNYKRFSQSNFDFNTLAKSHLSIVEYYGKNIAETALKQLKAEGGSVLFLPHPKIGSDKYQEFLKSYGLNATATGSTATDSTKKVNYAIDLPEENNPFFDEVFEGKISRTLNPFALPKIELSGGTSILKYKSGKAFLAKFKQSDASAYVMAAPVSGSNVSNFSANALFIPTLYKMAFLSSKNLLKPSYVIGKGTIELPLTDKLNSETGLSLQSAKLKVNPPYKILNNRLYINLESNTELVPDYYDVVINNKVSHKIALNKSSAESVMQFLSTDEINAEIAGMKNAVLISGIDDASQGLNLSGFNTSGKLWVWFVIAACFFFLIELLLLKLWVK